MLKCSPPIDRTVLQRRGVGDEVKCRRVKTPSSPVLPTNFNCDYLAKVLRLKATLALPSMSLRSVILFYSTYKPI